MVDAIEHDRGTPCGGFCADLRANPNCAGSEAAVGPQQRDDLVVRERLGTRPSRPTTRSALQSALTTASSVASTVAAKSASSSPSASACGAAGGREGEEDLAAAVVGDRARAREPQAGAPRDALELRGAQRRVGGHDRDAAAGGLRAARPAGGGGEQAPDRDAVDAQLARASRSWPARARRPSRRAATRLDVPMPPLKPKHIMPVPGADGALGDARRRAASASARPASAASTCDRARLAEPAVVALGRRPG